ncbi:MAG: hypothetical protein AB1782_08975 [Cyanobacteriota bacterium]
MTSIFDTLLMNKDAASKLSLEDIAKQASKIEESIDNFSFKSIATSTLGELNVFSDFSKPLELFDDVQGFIKNGPGGLISQLGDYVGGTAGDVIGTVGDSIGMKPGGIISNLGNLIGGDLGNTVSSIGEGFSGGLGGIVSTAGDLLGGGVGDFLSSAGGFITKGCDFLKSGLSGMLGTVGNLIGGSVGGVLSSVSTFLAGPVGIVLAIASLPFVQKFLDKIGLGFVGKALGFVGSIGSKILGGVFSIGKSIVSGIGKAIGGVAKAIGGFFKKL